MTDLRGNLTLLAKAPSADVMLSYWGTIRNGIAWQAKIECELDGTKLSIAATDSDPELAVAEVTEKYLRATAGGPLKGLAPKLVEGSPMGRETAERETIRLAVPVAPEAPRLPLSADDDIPF